MKENLSWYFVPSLRVNREALGYETKGWDNIISGLPGQTIERFKILTSGSKLPASENQTIVSVYKEHDIK